MKRNIIWVLLLCACVSLQAREYIGIMRAGGYTQEHVRARIDDQGNLTLYQVKFARMMPVHVDVVIPRVNMREEAEQIRLSGDSIIPTVHGKPYPSRIATGLHGWVNSTGMKVHMSLGTKPVSYEGSAQK